MSKYTNPSSLMDILLEAAAGVFVLLLLFWLCVQILIHIWFWIVGGVVLVVGIWLLVRWLRWRNSGWY